MPSVSVRFEPVGGVAQAEVGTPINFEIDITNTGRQTLTDLTLMIESDTGMPEFETWTTKLISPFRCCSLDKPRGLGVAFKVQQEGQFGAKLKVTTGNAVLAETPPSFVRGVLPKPKQPGIDVSIEFPEAIQVGRRANPLITIKNTGETTLTGLRVAIATDPALRATSVDSNNISRVRQDGGQLIWTPQDSHARAHHGRFGTSNARGIRSPLASCSSVNFGTGRQDQNVQDQFQTLIRITASNVPPPATGAAPTAPMQPRAGELQLQLSDYNDPRAVNEEIRYSLTITNRQNLGDRNVRIQLRMPQGLCSARSPR